MSVLPTRLDEDNGCSLLLYLTHLYGEHILVLQYLITLGAPSTLYE